MTPADDKTEFPPAEFDIDTEEGLEAFVTDLHRRRGVPERLRYPETDEAYHRMIAEADQGGFISMEKIEAWSRSLGTDHELPLPEPDQE